nr:ATP-dependent RNA helicase TDRD9-like [Penaeus vannamei]
MQKSPSRIQFYNIADGALAVKSKGVVSGLDGDLTYLGRVAAHLPVDPHLAKFIVMGYLFGVLRESIIIAAGLSLKSFHARPFQDELNAFLSKVSWAYGSFSDCLAVLNTYNLWQSMQIRGEFLRPGGRQEREWAKHSYVQLEALKEVDSW